MNPDVGTCVGKGGAHHLCDGTFLRGIGARLLPRQDHVRQGPDHVHGGLHPGLAHAPLQQAPRRLINVSKVQCYLDALGSAPLANPGTFTSLLFYHPILCRAHAPRSSSSNSLLTALWLSLLLHVSGGLWFF